MKKVLLFIFTICIFMQTTEAKKVKFAVDMRNEIVNHAGVHIAGDFQTAIGLPKNWIWDQTKLQRESADTNIYSIVLDLPAFKKYEFLFVNGQFDYEQEFVPVESRVGFNFVSNRWIYVDSLANDTTFVGAISFQGNAPEGYKLLRFKVNMQEITSIAKEGVHVAGSFQGLNPKSTILYSFDKKIYEIITYVKSGSYTYKYYNGNEELTSETVPSTCATGGYRNVEVNDHIVLDVVCFSSCENCKPISIKESNTDRFKISPNPVEDGFWVQNIEPNSTIKISNIEGKLLKLEKNTQDNHFIDCHTLNEGMYFITVEPQNSISTKTTKFIKL